MVHLRAGQAEEIAKDIDISESLGKRQSKQQATSVRKCNAQFLLEQRSVEGGKGKRSRGSFLKEAHSRVKRIVTRPRRRKKQEGAGRKDAEIERAKQTCEEYRLQMKKEQEGRAGEDGQGRRERARCRSMCVRQSLARDTLRG